MDRIAIKQEWELIELCAPTKTHFLQLPQAGIGIRGAPVTHGEKTLLPVDYYTQDPARSGVTQPAP